MSYNYDPDSDTLTIRLKEDIGKGEVADSDEVAAGLVADYSEQGEILQFELRNVRRLVDAGSVALHRAA